MKIISSPAKLMTVESETDLLRRTTPKFIEEAAYIQHYLKEKSPKFLSELMKISPKLADENWARNQVWKAKPTARQSAPALFAFSGEVYRGLDAKTMDAAAIQYLQKNFRMLSGLYGILRPSDKIMLYRLEMGRPFVFDTYENIYQFWTEKVTTYLKSELKKNEMLLNLASAEYGKVINRKNLDHPVIDVEFFEMRDGKPKNIVVYTKHARGALARFCAETQAKTLNDVKAFNRDGYLLDEMLSSDDKLVFTR